MTVIVAVKYDVGVVVASDRLAVGSARTESQKLLSVPRAIAGYAGMIDRHAHATRESVFTELYAEVDPAALPIVLPWFIRHRMRAMFSAELVFSFGVDAELLDRYAGERYHAHGLIATRIDGLCTLFYDDGSGNPATELSDGAMIHPGAPTAITDIPLAHTRAEAVERVGALIQECNRAFPTSCSGLEILILDSSGAHRVAYEAPIISSP